MSQILNSARRTSHAAHRHRPLTPGPSPSRGEGEEEGGVRSGAGGGKSSGEWSFRFALRTSKFPRRTPHAALRTPHASLVDQTREPVAMLSASLRLSEPGTFMPMGIGGSP